MKPTYGRFAHRMGVERSFNRRLRPIVAAALMLLWFTAVQASAVTYVLGTTSIVVGPAAGTNSVSLAVTPSSGGWTASTNAGWLHLLASAGTGSTNVIFTYDANSGNTRAGTLTISGQTLTVTQAGTGYVRASNSPVALATNGLNEPEGAAVDAAGNVYFADANNNAIKKWVLSSNSVVTVVSTNLNNINYPTGVAVDASGNIYFADSGNNAIKKWIAASNTVVTIVSTNLSGPFGVALDRSGNVYIADSGHNQIKEWIAASNTVVILVSTNLSSPQGVAVDVAGNVYIADHGNDAIKEWIAATSTVLTLATLGTGSEGVAVDGSGNVYFASTSDEEIQEWSAVGGTVSTLVSTNLNFPSGVAVDGLGNLYLANWGGNSIMEQQALFANTTTNTLTNNNGLVKFPTVLPTNENLLPPFLPTSDATWLSVLLVTNGVVTVGFAANTNNQSRSGDIYYADEVQSPAANSPQAAFIQGTNGTNMNPPVNSGVKFTYGGAAGLNVGLGVESFYYTDSGVGDSMGWSLPSGTNVPLITNWAMEWNPLNEYQNAYPLAVGANLTMLTVGTSSFSAATNLTSITVSNAGTGGYSSITPSFASGVQFTVTFYAGHTPVPGASATVQNGSTACYVQAPANDVLAVRGIEVYYSWTNELFWPTTTVSFNSSFSSTYQADGVRIVPQTTGAQAITGTETTVFLVPSQIEPVTVTNIVVEPLRLYWGLTGSSLQFSWFGGFGFLQSTPTLQSWPITWTDIINQNTLGPPNPYPPVTVTVQVPNTFYRVRIPTGDAPGF